MMKGKEREEKGYKWEGLIWGGGYAGILVLLGKLCAYCDDSCNPNQSSRKESRVKSVHEARQSPL